MNILIHFLITYSVLRIASALYPCLFLIIHEGVSPANQSGLVGSHIDIDDILDTPTSHLFLIVSSVVCTPLLYQRV